MKDFWTILINAIMAYLSKWLSPLDPTLAPRMGAALEKAAVGLPAPVFPVGAAPDELKDLIRKLVTDFVNNSFANRPLIRNLVLAVVNNLPDTLLDTIWDSLFKAGAVASPMPVRSTLSPEYMKHIPNPLALALASELT